MAPRPEATSRADPPRHLDGLNLSLAQGTGVATYTRMLAQVVFELGYEIGVVYASAQTPPKNRLLREVAFFDEKRAIKVPLSRQVINCVADQLRNFAAIRPLPVEFDGVVVQRQFEGMLPARSSRVCDPQSVRRCSAHFASTNRFA